MKVKVLTAKKANPVKKVSPQILTPSYLNQLGTKTSYNIKQAENRREVGKRLALGKRFM